MTPLFTRRQSNIDYDRRFYDRPVRWATRVPLILLLPICAGVQWFAMQDARVADAYAGTVYPLLSRGYGALTGWIPFSVAEALLVLSGVWLVAVVWRGIRRVRLGSRSPADLLKHGLVNALATAGLLCAVFLLWGMNYNRTPLAQTADLEIATASTFELRALCESLVAQTNEARLDVREDKTDGTMVLNHTPSESITRTWLGFHLAAQLHDPLFRGYAGRVKGLAMLATPATRLGWGGIFVAVTGEPTVNTQLPPVALPFAACHQLGHQVGWAREAEASFVGWLACTIHPDPDFRYAGYLAGLDSAMRALYVIDSRSWDVLIDRCTPEVREDWRILQQSRVGGQTRICPGIADVRQLVPGASRTARGDDPWLTLLLAHHRREASRTASTR